MLLFMKVHVYPLLIPSFVLSLYVKNLEMRSHYCYDIAWHGFPDTHCYGHLQHVSPTRNYKFVVESDNHDLNSICDWSHSDSASSRSS